MTYMQRGNKFKQISGHLIVYSIYVFLGGTALVFFHRLWNTTVGNLIIFMSPYIIFTCHKLWLSFLGKQTLGYTACYITGLVSDNYQGVIYRINYGE